MPDHFYTTDPHGELAPYGGYVPENSPGFVYTSGHADTIPIYRWYNPGNSDHFYCRDPNGELAPQIGYKSEGVAWHMYADQKPDTVALYRWFGNNDHFYTTDPNGELAPALGYNNEGVLGYVLTSALYGSVKLNRWHKSPRYELNGTTLSAWCYRQKTGEMRESKLNLDHCIAMTNTWGWTLVAEEAPDNLTDPDNDRIHPEKLSDSYAKGDLGLSLRDGPVIHMRLERWTIGKTVHDADLDLAPYLRRAFDGVIEFVHPQPDHSMDWIHPIGDICKAINDALEDKSPLEEVFDQLLEQFQEAIKQEDPGPDVEAFMKGTYVHDGRLIRRGT